MQNQKSVSDTIQQGVGSIKRMFTGEEDIISVIKEDHKPLKDLISIMKSDDGDFSERKRAFMEFAPLLVTHAKAEEKSLYEFMKTRPELKEYAFEGETEHSMADQLCEEAKRATSEDEIAAKIKVLAESVEHHIQEEENNILPDVQKNVGESTLVGLTKIYVDWQEQIIAEGQDDAPHEAELRGTPH
jgi:hemerythrin superfamily protein